MTSLDEGVFIGIDIGSSSSKAIAIDGGGNPLVTAGRGTFAVTRPNAGGWEIEPGSLFDAACEAVRELPADIRRASRAVAVTGQMCGLVPLRRDRRPAGRAFRSSTTGASPRRGNLDERFGAHLLEHERNGSLPVYTLPKLLWLRQHQPERFEQTDLVVMPKDYVRGCLTDTWVTEPTDASGTLVFDQLTSGWDEALLAELGLPVSQWPEITGSTSLVGEISPAAAEAIGLPAGTPVAGGASDMAAVPVGIGATTADDLVVSFGTAVHLISPVDSLSHVWPVQQYSSALGSPWFRFGAVYSGGACAQWLVDLFGEEGGFEVFEAPGNRPAREQVLFMPYLAGAGAPHEVPGAAGAFVGLRLGHDRSDLAQAVLAGLVFEAAAIHAAHDPDGRRRVHVTGGGMRIGPLVQIVADVLGRDVIPSRSPEAASIGAAKIAAVAVGGGGFESLDPTPTTVSPDPAGVDRLALLHPLYERAARVIRELAIDG